MPEEEVVFAIFDDVPHDKTTSKLLPHAFRTDRMNAHNLSLARASFTTRATFEREVVQSAKLVGVARVQASRLRDLIYTSTSEPKFNGRAACVSDKVNEGDHAGHAALGWAESQEGMKPNQRARAREFIRDSLVEVFGTICRGDDVCWAAEVIETSP